MRFVPVREFRNNSASVLRRLRQEGSLVVTSNGKPVALVRNLNEKNWSVRSLHWNGTRFGFNPARVTQILDYFQLVGLGVTGKSSGRRLPDLTDLPFLDAPLEGQVTRIVTGNLKDFPASVFSTGL